jgi:hypothetical protein
MKLSPRRYPQKKRFSCGIFFCLNKTGFMFSTASKNQEIPRKKTKKRHRFCLEFETRTCTSMLARIPGYPEIIKLAFHQESGKNGNLPENHTISAEIWVFLDLWSSCKAQDRTAGA